MSKLRELQRLPGVDPHVLYSMASDMQESSGRGVEVTDVTLKTLLVFDNYDISASQTTRTGHFLPQQRGVWYADPSQSCVADFSRKSTEGQYAGCESP